MVSDARIPTRKHRGRRAARLVWLALGGAAALALLTPTPVGASPRLSGIGTAAAFVPEPAVSTPPASAASPPATPARPLPPPSPSAATAPAVSTPAVPRAPTPAPATPIPQRPPALLTLVAAGTYRDCTGATPLPSARIYVDACYHGGTMLMAHDYGAGAVFFQLQPGEALVYGGRTYHVDARRVMSVGSLLEIFDWQAPLVLLTCDGGARLVLTAR